MVIGSILVAVVVVIALIWYVEPRAFMYWFHKIAYSVHSQSGFIDDVKRYFPQAQVVERNFATIRQECLGLVGSASRLPKAHQVDKYNGIISSDNGPAWRTFYLKVYSGWFRENCAKCPQTYQLFKEMDNVTGIMFSIMEPGNRIPPHKGELKGILRYQLPLQVPSAGQCVITVHGETRDYATGRSILFDDNLMHHVANNTNEYRVVLFLDIQKESNPLVRALDNFFMKLVVISPRFRNANVKMS